MPAWPVPSCDGHRLQLEAVGDLPELAQEGVCSSNNTENPGSAAQAIALEIIWWREGSGSIRLC